MSEPFIAEIRIFAGNFAPRGWAFCDGQLLPIAQNTALFSLIGTTYGGDGRTTTALPNLSGRVPMHPGRGPGLSSRRLGERGGVETVTLTEAQMPAHSHAVHGLNNPALVKLPSSSAAIARTSGAAGFQTDSASNLAAMAPEAILATGNTQAHQNVQPVLAVNHIIALVGTYPSRS